MTHSKTNKRGHGRLAILDRRDDIEAMLARGYRASEIYRKLQNELGITQSVFHKHLATLGLTTPKKDKAVVSNDTRDKEKKEEETPRRLTTKEKLTLGLLRSSDKPSFVHNPVPDPKKLL